MNKRLYVGGLSYSVDDDGLRELFTPFGTVSFVKVIRDFHSGRSKGFGFVEMSTPEEAKEAIEALHGSIHERRTITVSEANPPDSNAGGGTGGRRTGGGAGGRRTGGAGGRGMGGAGGNGGAYHRGREQREEQY
ncbi:RNA recognition motif domain-containing protein [Rickettsiella grylli]|uniref:RNA-binding protein n=1 Tax=Rickettsiella grylli TaxID=59196 RepID=A8PPG7_9COXI|nr:RNA-binding protein [Rickettsiella grylli]EDP46679.1 RNA-binding protein [Rickettsiella grylli]